MPRISTDDAARRQEFHWLGPVNMPAPFKARGSAWVMAILLGPVAVICVYVATPFLDLLPLPGAVVTLVHGLLAIAAGLYLTIRFVRWVGRQVGPTRPLRHIAAVVRAELDTPRPGGETTVRVTGFDASRVWAEHRDEHTTAVVARVPAFLRVDHTDSGAE